MLAKSASLFANSSDVRLLVWWGRKSVTDITYHGLRIQLWLIPVDDAERIFLASLACMMGAFYNHSPGIYLKRMTGFRQNWRSGSDTQFVRLRGSQVEDISSEMKVRGQHATVYVQHNPQGLDLNKSVPSHLLIFDIGVIWTSDNAVASQSNGFEVLPVSSWDPQAHVFTAVKHPGALGVVIAQHNESKTLTIFGFADTGQPWVSTVLDPPSFVAEWQQHLPSANASATSEAMITATSNGSVICKSSIWLNVRRGAHGQELYSIVLEGELRPTLPMPVAEKADATSGLVHGDDIRDVEGEVNKWSEYDSVGRLEITGNTSFASSVMFDVDGETIDRAMSYLREFRPNIRKAKSQARRWHATAGEEP